MFIGANRVFQVSSQKTVFLRGFLLDLNCKMSIQMPIAFTNLRLTISCV